MERPKRTAFILNMTANGLGIARTLGRRGIPVVGVESKPELPGLHSRYVRPLITPDIVKEPAGVLELLLKEAEKLDEKGVLFPASDAGVLFMSRNRNALEPYFDFIIPSERVEEAMVNKRLQYEEAKRIGIPLTEIFYPRSMEDLDEVVTGVHFPAFIKPFYSHIWYKTFGNKGFIVNTPEELRTQMAKVFATDLEVTVQSIIMPPGKNLYVMAAYFGKNGYISPIFTWEKVRQYPPNFGVASLSESMHLPDVAEMGLKFMKGLDYRGIGYVEFKRDPRDGELKLIEMNGRTWMQNEHSDGAGLPLTLIEYQDLIDGPLPEVSDFRDGVLWWDGMNDLDSFWRLRMRRDMTFTQWVGSWYGSDICAYYAKDDIKPALQRIGYGVKLAKLMMSLISMKEDEDMVPMPDKGPTMKGAMSEEMVKGVKRAI